MFARLCLISLLTFAFCVKLSSLSTSEIMSIHIASDGVVCCAPCSTIPALKQPYEKGPEELLLAIQDVDVEVPLHQLTKQELPSKETVLCAQQKAPTRRKVLALNQSLDYLLKLRLGDGEPMIPLRPPMQCEVRCHVVDESGTPRAYYWNSVTKQTTWQCTVPSNMPDTTVRFSSLTDEAETGSAIALANSGIAMLCHRDTCHKLHREEMLAMNDVDEVYLAMKESLLILKSEQAPWNSGMFGRRMKDAHRLVHLLPLPHVLLDICGPGIIDDLSLSPTTTQAELKEVLCNFAKGGYRTGGQHKLGRWCDWVDSFSKLHRTWHMRLFFHLMALALEGISPFAALAGQLEQLQQSEKNSSNRKESEKILPRVLRVARQKCWPFQLWKFLLI